MSKRHCGARDTEQLTPLEDSALASASGGRQPEIADATADKILDRVVATQSAALELNSQLTAMEKRWRAAKKAADGVRVG